MKIWQHCITNVHSSFWYRCLHYQHRAPAPRCPVVLARLSLSTFLLLVWCGTLSACSGTKAPDHSSLEAGSTVPQTNFIDASNVDATVSLVVTPTASDMPRCTSPYAPVLESVPTGTVLPVFANGDDLLEVGTGTADASSSTNWLPNASIRLPDEPGDLRVFARLAAVDCVDASTFSQVYSVRSSFAPAVGASGSTAISKDDSRFRAWASRLLEVSYGDRVSDDWETPDQALGPADDDTSAVVSLGEGGSITLGFDATLKDGDGYDFAVFENGFSDNYLELAFVEVSSDGTHFVRFDAASLVDSSVAAYGTINPELLQGFAGKYRVGWATPFDLSWLKWRPEVRANLVDLSNITAIRVVDVIGDGRVRDSFGHVVYDPCPTTGSAGFDLDAIGLLNIAQ